MTDAAGNNTMTPRPLGLLFLAGLAMWVALFWGGCRVKDALAATEYQACPVSVSFPVSVHINEGVDPLPWIAAINEWDEHYPGSFVAGDGGVEVVPSDTTWVEIPCGHRAVIHSGNGHEAGLEFWAAHELGHTLGLRDWGIGTTSGPQLNPVPCNLSFYQGIMSYCTPRSQWFGPDDDAMMRSLGYRWRLHVAAVAH